MRMAFLLRCRREPSQLVGERQLLRESADRGAVEQPAAEVVLERVDMAAQCGPVQERRRVHEPEQRLDGPLVPDRELELAFVGEPRSSQHLLVGILVHRFLPTLWHAVADAELVAPALEGGIEDALPAVLTAPRRPTPQERDATAFGQVP